MVAISDTLSLTGQASFALCERFDSVIGADPSSAMISVAQQNTNARLKFIQSSAEQLSFLPDESVDLVTAGKSYSHKEKSAVILRER